MNGKDMVFSYLNLDKMLIDTKICSDPVKINDNILVIYNTKNYTIEEVIDWIEKIKGLFKINFEYGITTNNFDNYHKIVEKFIDDYSKKFDKDLSRLRNNYDKLVENSDGNLLYFYFNKDINLNIKYLLFVILRYGICSSFKELKEIIIYLNKERGLPLWESIFFSHFEKSFDENKCIDNANNPVFISKISYFQFLNSRKTTVFFDLDKILDPNYLKGLKLSQNFSYNFYNRIGSNMFSVDSKSKVKKISFKETDDKNLIKFIKSFSYENRFKSYLKKLSFDELDFINTVYERLKKDKFDVIKNNNFYLIFLKKNEFLFFMLMHNPEYHNKNLEFYYDNFINSENLETIDYKKSLKFISNYTNAPKNLDSFEAYDIVLNSFKAIFGYENFINIYELLIKKIL